VFLMTSLKFIPESLYTKNNVIIFIYPTFDSLGKIPKVMNHINGATPVQYLDKSQRLFLNPLKSF